MSIRIARFPLGGVAALLVLLAVPARAQVGQCGTLLTVDTSIVSVSAGGVQTISVLTNGGEREFSIVGSFSGTTPSDPWLAYGGLYLARDRYLVQSYLGLSPLIPGGFPHAPGGHRLHTNAQGQAVQPIVVPPMALARYVGRTVRHGVFSENWLDYSPYCGSNTVALTFAP